jgi:hypothetical protein
MLAAWFLHPGVFFPTGVALVSLPIVIHLLNRRRFRMMDWAAMRFLWESVRRNRRRLRIEELILLALRCLALLLLAVALARFVGCRAMKVLPGGAESQTAVFLLDDSYSMGQRVGGGTIFSAAATDIAEQIEKLSPTDHVAILLTSAEEDAEPFLPHTADTKIEQLSARLKGLKASDLRARLAQALAAAARIFQNDKSTTRRLYLYSDFRRADLADDKQAEEIHRQFETLREMKVEVVAMDFGREPKNNLTLESMEMLDKFAVANVPVRIRLEVRNNGSAMVRNVEVRLTAKVTTSEGLREVELPAGSIESIDRRETGRLEFQVTCPRAGPSIITARLPADELAADSEAHLALDVREATHVLAVDGRPDLADPTESASFFFVHALDPDRNGSEGAKVEVVSPTAMGETPLEKYDLIALLDVGELAVALDANGQAVYPQLDALSDFVRAGGGLVIFTGDGINSTFYNGPMHAGGSGLSPLPVGPRKGDPEKRERFYRLDPKSLAAEGVLKVFHSFLVAGTDPTQFIRFYAYTSTSPASLPPASAEVKPPRILARFADEDNSPAIVARQFGKGTVLIFYTDASMRWSDWPADENGTFVAVLNDLLPYLAKPQETSLSARVGEPIVYELTADLRDATAGLITPRHPEQPVVPLVPAQQADRPGTPGRQLLRYERPDHAGQYTLELSLPDQTTRQAIFARTVDPAEGDLACGREPVLAAAFGSEEFLYIDRTAAHPGSVAKAQPQKEYWTWALAILALVLAAETFLGQRFGHYMAPGRSPAKPG